VLLDHHLPERPIIPTLGYTTPISVNSLSSDHIKIGVVGAGGYAKNIHLPNLRKLRDATVHAVGSRSGGSAAVAARKYGAAYATSDANEIFSDENIDAVLISTRHSSHASLAIEALKAKKHVFIEKPMAATTAECLRIINAQKESQVVVRVGFNRRFSPMLMAMKSYIGSGPKIFSQRICASGSLYHWSNTEQEGGRLVGEGVHFFDLANWMMEAYPQTVSAQFLGDATRLNPNLAITLRYRDGSLATIIYTAIGARSGGKEYFELFGNNRSVAMNDYKTFKAYGRGVTLKRPQGRRNKGQFEVLADFVSACRSGLSTSGADAEAGLWATAIADAAVESAISEKVIDMEQFASSGD